ncbi:hypothetical protein M758_4G238600 [Ceratodon purpureus]|uniref:Uncharacterized protein n=1 Tax=Ceratodon purpureus TaxID=3225 RepID=A0A8T0IEB3_CERPU|nr:hypothetical protein KC19_4G234100 [Ceratodon purpureus]KAG0620730.1 hypothetical protein M758_4G238600 [Ceratodon purpureus]
MGKKIMPLLALLLLVALVESYTVTVYNPARMLVDVLVDDKNFKVETDRMSLDLNREEQSLDFTTGQGDQVMSVHVKDGDMVVLVPALPIGGANIPAVQVVEVPGVTDYSSNP